MLTAISVDSFLKSLPLMGQGMLGIFVVTAVLIGCVYLLNRLTGKKK
ncbi:MAG: hypothetical protein II363_02830 [Clostridia bacterium]|nr:hypothetical protein [Clostridia bacterium]